MQTKAGSAKALVISNGAIRQDSVALTPGKLKPEVDMNTIIGWVLQAGVIVSSVIIALGTLLLLLSPGGLTVDLGQAYPHSIEQVWTGILAFQPQAIIALGLLCLIATPVLRVAISIFAFAREHDRMYVLITLLVLAILITSFVLGKGGA
ncbi:MAG TPA: DUF1634 domain-containing protein [Ktedonosporobacter sp.]|nr:DUF1634 domain-containing protein [Ktedonosporobacter sp.]